MIIDTMPSLHKYIVSDAGGRRAYFQSHYHIEYERDTSCGEVEVQLKWMLENKQHPAWKKHPAAIRKQKIILASLSLGSWKNFGW